MTISFGKEQITSMAIVGNREEGCNLLVIES
jgi:hypothetical protein